MIIRQISKNKAGKHYEQVKAESEIKNYDKSQPNEKMDGDLSWLDNYKNASKDFTTQEKKSTEKPEENTKSEDIPEFFLDREKESEEKK
jgi:lysyl-tRNA synthetase class I